MDETVDSLVSSLMNLSSSELDETLESLESLGETLASTDLDSSASLEDDTDNPQFTDDLTRVEPDLRKPLHEDSDLSIWDCYLHIMRYCLRHSLSKSAVSDLLALVGILLPKVSSPSLYKFKKVFLSLYEDITFNSHYCCSRYTSLIA